MKDFKKFNNLLGWACFLLATSVYVMTMERTGSWWDCGEFISCDYKLQVPHQPGAPLYILIYKLFTLLAGNDHSKIAYWGNFASACCSGATILFLFWTISAFAKKILIKKEGDYTKSNLLIIFGSALIGALAYTFSDSFWFDAVESEVYALASLTVAITFWAALKWEAISEKPGADRWLVFISLMIGLSLGVHLLNLLTIPAVVFVVYFKRFPRPKKYGWILTLLVSCLILGFVMDGIVPGTVNLTAFFDRLFVNSFGFPFGSGLAFFLCLLIAFLAAALIYTRRTNRRTWNTAFLCLTFVFIGFGVFFQVPIRAHANPPLNNQHPDDPYSLVYYLTRSQYGGGAPLIKGQMFTSRPVETVSKGPVYGWNGSSYAVISQKLDESYNADELVLFPRIWDGDNHLGHADFYRNWLKLSKDSKPSWIHDNLGFFFSYQAGWMFGRYFLWNFVGRQNDVQGLGDNRNGNWISGIKPLDAIRLGKQPPVPAAASPNLAHNSLFFLPLILGLIGMFFQYKKDPKDLATLFIFFLFTGIAIVVFLNQTGPEPRERDYSFGGAFYTFCIWIGLGVIGIAEFFKKGMRPLPAIACAFLLCLFCVPVLMADQEWDDHDRSARTTVKDFSADYLNSCEKNAILFTMGDNDTFPLWYAQQVEGIRPDVRIVNLSLLGIDWYVKQTHEAQDGTPGVAFTLPSSSYDGDKRSFVPFVDGKIQGAAELKDLVELLGSDDQAAKVQNGADTYNYLPTKRLKMSIDADQVIRTGTVPAADRGKIASEISWTIPANSLTKADVAELDIIATNNWKRPIYFATNMPSSTELGLKDYFRQEGIAYRLMPLKPEKNTDEMAQLTEPVNAAPMYDHFMNQFKWGSINKDKFLDPESRSMVPILTRAGWNLAYNLYRADKTDSSKRVLDYMVSQLPSRIPEFDDRFSINQLQFDTLVSSLYYDLKDHNSGHRQMKKVADYTTQYLNYFLEAGSTGQDQNVQFLLSMLEEQSRISNEKGDPDLGKNLHKSLVEFAPKFGLGNVPD